MCVSAQFPALIACELFLDKGPKINGEILTRCEKVQWLIFQQAALPDQIKDLVPDQIKEAVDKLDKALAWQEGTSLAWQTTFARQKKESDTRCKL